MKKKRIKKLIRLTHKIAYSICNNKITKDNVEKYYKVFFNEIKNYKNFLDY